MSSLVKGIGSALGSAFGIGGGGTDRSAEIAANTQAEYEREALDYLKEVEALPQQFREGALTKLGGIAGLEGGEGNQQELIDQARQSPLYSAIIGTQAAGEDTVMRNAGMTGNLRSGNVKDQLFSYTANLENTALNEAYNQQLQGLQGLAQLPSNANNIATATSGIGSTLAQGQIGTANLNAGNNQNSAGNLMGLASLGLKAYSAFSDRRLKKNIELVGTVDGYNWYKWDWNKVANVLGLKGSSQGVLADEIVDQQPNAVSFKNGFMFIDYGKLEEQHA